MHWVLALPGLFLGGFINVLADNLPPDAEGIRRGPRAPRCRQCGRPHHQAYWLVTASYLARGGRCEHCGARRGLRGLLVELTLAAGLPLVWVWAARPEPEGFPPWLRFGVGAVVLALLVLITVIDIEHRLILRIVVLPGVLFVALAGSLDPSRGLVKTLVGGAAGFGIMYAVYLLAEVYTQVQNRLRGRPMEEVAFGGGDVNLAAVVGCLVGWPGVLLALMIAIFSGAAYSLGIIVPQLVQRRYSPHSVIPYGPFLVLGAFLLYFFANEVQAALLAGSASP